MNDSNKEHFSQGLARKVPYKPPGPAGVPENLTLTAKHILFSDQTAWVLRLTKLSSPVNDSPDKKVSILLYQLIRARAFVQAALHDKELMVGIPFTILDGTSWEDATHRPQWSYDIISINILWDNDLPIVSVLTGLRRVIKNHALHMLTSDHSCVVNMFEYHASDSPEQAVARLEEATSLWHRSRHETLYDHALGDCYSEDIEYPVAAAIFHDDVVWYAPRPYRHHHVLQTLEYFDATSGSKVKAHQGFLTNHGNFVNRYRGMYRAVLMGQLTHGNTTFMDQIRMADKKFHVDDPKLSGIVHLEDRDPNGYLMLSTPLFSEDLW